MMSAAEIPRFAGKVALITGGASGIGRAMAELSGHEGAHVVIADRCRDEGEALAARVSRNQEAAEFVETDVTCLASVKAMVSRAMSEHGRIDCAIDNAGVSETPIDLADYSAE